MTQTPKLELALPPSVNAMFISTRFGRKFNSPETRKWYEYCIKEVYWWMRENKVNPFDSWVYCDMKFYLRRRGSDTHNYLKAFNDGLQKAGLLVNDSIILNRIQEVEYSPRNPRIVCTFTKK